MGNLSGANKHYHLIGIGGIGMSGIARLLLRRGMKVSGSDLKESRLTRGLEDLGAQVYIGHSPLNIKGANLVIYSSAIRADNPEIMEAKKQGITLIRRAQALAGLMEEETVVTVTGSHGKTTTASLISYLLIQAGLSPTIAVGGILRNIDANAYLGDGKFFVAEADESDGTFLYYRPKYSIVTNIDYEHLDYYKEFKYALSAFREFFDKTREDGCLFVCNDDTNLREMIKDYKNKYVLFGLKAGAHIYPRDIKIDGLTSAFDCVYRDKLIDRFHLALGGEHNISNALAVIALGLELGLDLGVIKNTLSGYQGAKRRLEIKFANRDYLLIDDYAHHPTEIRATLSALGNLKFNRLIAVFQPHRYTRTKLLLDEFSRSFDSADCVIITDIYPAGEEPQGISGRLVYERIKAHSPDKPATFLSREEIAAHVLGAIRPGDLVVTLGAGDIVRTSDELVEGLKRKS